MLMATQRGRMPRRVPLAPVLVVLGLMVGTLIALSDTATAAAPKRPACRQSAEVTCSIPAHVKRFKNGKYGRVHGVHVRLFAGPAAKKALMMKLARKMPLKPFAVEKSATCSKAPQWACAHGRTASRGGTRAGHERCMQSDMCRAYNRYGASASAVTCIGVDATYYRPSCIPYKLQNPGWEGFTKRQIQIAGNLILCGATVGIGIVKRSTATLAILGGSSCLWNCWRDVDPG